MRSFKFTTVAAGVLAGGLVLTACGSDADDTAPTGADGAEVQTLGEVDAESCDPADGMAAMPDPEGTGEDPTEISIGVFSGWDENYVSTELVKLALEEQGYTVDLQELEAGPAYTGVAQGDLDLHMDAALPTTHARYIDQFGDDLENLGCWYDKSVNTVAVNADSPAQSLEDLADHADTYGNRIVGIEPGAGLTGMMQNEVIPTYGLDDWKFPTSSTAAMLAELDRAMAAGENIAVTLWHPHWAYAAHDLRDLEDPEGALGGSQRIFNAGRPGFSAEYPNATQLLKNLHLTDEQLLELEELLVIKYERKQNQQAITEWLDANPDFLDNWRAGTLG